MKLSKRVNKITKLEKMEEKMGFQKVAEIKDFEENEKKLVEVDDKAILLTKVAGAYYAISNKCPHMG